VGNPGFNFYTLPPGGATQVYRISLSNDGATFGNYQNFTIFDRKCMDCGDVNCIQKVLSFETRNTLAQVAFFIP